MSRKEMEKFVKTDKQKKFSNNFFADAEDYEAWEDINFDNVQEIDGENTYEIKAEDLKSFAEACFDPNPLMNDEEYAKKSVWRELVPHPIIVTPIAFWCIGTKGRGNWIRIPGARNPGQEIEIYEKFRVGETIHIKIKPYDRYIKRGKYYMINQTDMYNQNNVKKCSWYVTLILAKTKKNIRDFIEGKRGYED